MSGIFCVFLFLLVLSGIIILAVAAKSRKLIRCLLLTLFTGVASLFGVNLLAPLTGFCLNVNIFSLSVCSLGGVPGTIFLLLARLILNQ